MSAVIQPVTQRIRPMQVVDIKAVRKVECAAYGFPWTASIFRDCLRVGYYCCVMENPLGLVGHGVMSYAISECHILNICIHPDYQGQGLGRNLVLHQLDVAKLNGVRMAFLEVRLSNNIAYKLYESLGFDEVGIRKEYYPAEWGREDAMILAYDMHSGSASGPDEM